MKPVGAGLMGHLFFVLYMRILGVFEGKPLKAGF